MEKYLEKNTEIELASATNTTISTVKRWVSLKAIPLSYQFDLMKLNKEDINYSDFSFKEKDQFFTPPSCVNHILGTFYNIIKLRGENEGDFFYIDPSAGNGAFLNSLPKERSIGIDIESPLKSTIKQDYLDYIPEKNNKIVVIGNPPFGLRGHLALKFINHSAKFADFVCFILPQLFESDGKGSPKKRVNGVNLIHSEKLDTHFLSPENVKIKVNCIFQIWSKKYTNSIYDTQITCKDIKVYSVSDGKQFRNKKMFNKCDIFLPSSVYDKGIMRPYKTFLELPNLRGYGIVFLDNTKEYIDKVNSINWASIGFLSTNGAINLRTSLIIKALA